MSDEFWMRIILGSLAIWALLDLWRLVAPITLPDDVLEEGVDV